MFIKFLHAVYLCKPQINKIVVPVLHTLKYNKDVFSTILMNINALMCLLIFLTIKNFLNLNWINDANNQHQFF